ncbi:MAG TPA: hypothetical protein VLU47_06705 [Blastocatellia bacterium]|nr:hypothetical protein [Blastocatellia bacterium]
MSKKLDKNEANLERLARTKISTIQRIVLEDVRPGGSAMNPQVRSRKIETAVFESVQVRKALKRFRRMQAKRLKNERADR